MTHYLDSSQIERSQTKKGKLKNLARAGLVGSVVGLLSGAGSSYLFNKAGDYIESGQREIQELRADVRSLTGQIDRAYSASARRLEETVQDFKVDPDYDIAEPADIKKIEELLQNVKDFEDHYTFVERAIEFKDRVQKRLLNAGETLESYQPSLGRTIYGRFADLVAGKKPEEQVKKERELYMQRLEHLCKLYDTNEDNLVAQSAVMDELDRYVRLPTIPEEEKEFYNFLKRSSPKQREFFLKSSSGFNLSQEVLSNLDHSLKEAQSVKKLIRENSEYLESLQGLLREGIDHKREVRETTLRSYREFKQDFDTQLKRLRSSLDRTIEEVEVTNQIDIITREEFIKQGFFDRNHYDNYANFFSLIGGLALGAYGGFKSHSTGKKKLKERALRDGLNLAVGEHNRLASENEELKRCPVKEINHKTSQDTLEENLNRGSDYY